MVFCAAVSCSGGISSRRFMANLDCAQMLRARSSGLRAGAQIVLLGQRNELGLVAGNDVEAALFPFSLGLLDPFLARRHEIPPDVARAFHCGSADQNDACLAGGGYCDGVAWPEHQKLTCPEAIAGNIDLARNDIERTLLCVGVKRKRRPQRK